MTDDIIARLTKTANEADASLAELLTEAIGEIVRLRIMERHQGQSFRDIKDEINAAPVQSRSAQE